MALTNLNNTNSPSYATFFIAFACALALLAVMYRLFQHCLWIDRRHHLMMRVGAAEERREWISSMRFAQYGEDTEGVELDDMPIPPPPAITHHVHSSLTACYLPHTSPPQMLLPPLPNQCLSTLLLLTQEQEDKLMRIYNKNHCPPSPAYSLPSVNSRGY